METVLSNFNGMQVMFNPLSILLLYVIYRVSLKITDLDKMMVSLSKDVEFIKNLLDPEKVHKIHRLPTARTRVNDPH